MSALAADPPSVGLAAGRGVWVVLPTYNERENVEPMMEAIFTALPEASLLVVDDSSLDGTGEMADTFAARDERLAVLHRPGREGLGAAYREGFRWVLARDETRAVVQMDCDFSNDPATLPKMLAPLMRDADLVLGTTLHAGGHHGRLAVAPTPDQPRRHALRAHGADAPVPGPHRRIQGLARGAAARRAAARDVRVDRRGAMVVEVPIVFRERVAGSSKMTGGVVREALLLVLRLRLESRWAKM